MDPTRAAAGEANRAFPETSDPACYVPRKATEDALSSIQGWAASDGSGSTIAGLRSRPGLGKTTLLRVFESRANARAETGLLLPTALYLPYAGISTMDLCDWVLGLLGRPDRVSRAEDPPAAALSALLGLAGSSDAPFYLLLDDADSLPAETLRVFAQVLPRERSGLRILMALNDDARSSRLLASLDVLRPSVIELREAMTREETAAYVAARLRLAGLDEGRIDSESVRRIHVLSGGIPRRIHAIAASYLESGGRGGGRSTSSDGHDFIDWMGSPIEESP